MISKADRFYFENLAQAAEVSYKEAAYLVTCLLDYRLENIQNMLETMHEFEHTGDTKKHEMSSALARAFVTPIDREDLELISQNIDEVTDRIEEVLQRFYVDRIEKVTPFAVEFAKKIVECCALMNNMLDEFVNFKKSAKLHEMVVGLNQLEEECDELYLKASLDLLEQSHDVLQIYFWREIYDKMEKCADACEHVGDCVSMVVMKNT